MGPLETKILGKLEAEFKPLHGYLENESHNHSVPKNAETHFKLLLVSEKFVGLSRVERARLVHAALAAEFKKGLHALTERLLTPDEWLKVDQVDFTSPPCFGGSKSEGRT